MTHNNDHSDLRERYQRLRAPDRVAQAAIRAYQAKQQNQRRWPQLAVAGVVLAIALVVLLPVLEHQEQQLAANPGNLSRLPSISELKPAKPETYSIRITSIKRPSMPSNVKLRTSFPSTNSPTEQSDSNSNGA